jgi:hypothetical protein
MRATTAGRFPAKAAAVGGLLWLCGAAAHANGMVVLGAAVGSGLTAVVALIPLVAVEAMAYQWLLGGPALRSWLSALLGNLAAAPPMGFAALCLALARWEWGSGRPGDARNEALVALACVVGLIAAKLGITRAMHRKGPTKRPVWKVALGVSALTTALVIGVCMALYDVG